MLQLNHALRDPQVAGLGRDLNYFLEGGQPHFSPSPVFRAFLCSKSINLTYPFLVLSAQSEIHTARKAPRLCGFDLVQLFRIPSKFCTDPCLNKKMLWLHGLQGGIFPFLEEVKAW